MKHRFLYIYILFIASLVTLLLLVLLFLKQLTSLKETNESVEKTYKVLYKIQALDTYINEIETSAKGYMLTRDSDYLKPVLKQSQTINGSIDTLKALISDDGKQRNRLSMLHLAIKFRMNFLNTVISKVARKDTAGLEISLLNGKRLVDELRSRIRELETGELLILDEKVIKKARKENLTPSYFKVLVCFTGLITVVSFFFINQELRRRIRYQKKLERKVNELRRSNDELEQIAHVASHHMQEPLRKIRTFSSRLQVKHAGELNDEVSNILRRIDVSAIRMHELVHDLVNFTNLINSSEIITTVDLNAVAKDALEELASKIASSKAVVTQDKLPVINGYYKQLKLMIGSLVDNSLKFRREGVRPEINISLKQEYIKEQLYYNVSVEDNGIGFDEEFAGKIFVLFQRLHGQESGYAGQGIGLAIVKRVMVNHNGLVFAKGRPGEGAVFSLFFPIHGED